MQILKRLSMALFVAAAACGGFPQPLRACTCNGSPLLDLFEAADFAFVGTVTANFDPRAGAEVISSADPIGYRFTVEMAWKGVDADTMTVWSARFDASCGYRFRTGVRYIVMGQNRGGQPRSGLCSGVTPFEGALEARYVLPFPARIARGAAWPALARGDLLDFLREGNQVARNAAASLLASEFGGNDAFGLSLFRLLITEPVQSATILAAGSDSTGTAAALAQLADQSLDSDLAETRAAAVEGLGWLTQRDALIRVMRRGFADQSESVRAAARRVLLARYNDLARSEADELVPCFIASIGDLTSEEGWVGVHQLRYFPGQCDQIMPFLKAVADTATDRQLKITASDVMKSLPGGR